MSRVQSPEDCGVQRVARHFPRRRYAYSVVGLRGRCPFLLLLHIFLGFMWRKLGIHGNTGHPEIFGSNTEYSMFHRII